MPMHRAAPPPVVAGERAGGPPSQQVAMGFDSAGLDEDYRPLIDCLGHDPAPIDLLVARSGLTAPVVSSMLLILELRGYVRAEAGGNYVRMAET
jgi:DNA processing protein